MGKRNAYLEKQETTQKVYMDATADTYTQFMVDLIILALNDPAIMGKNVFGKKRIQKVVAGIQEKYDYYIKAMQYPKTKKERAEMHPEYYREKMDEALRRILGEDGFQDFAKRYDWLKEIRF